MVDSGRLKEPLLSHRSSGEVEEAKEKKIDAIFLQRAEEAPLDKMLRMVLHLCAPNLVTNISMISALQSINIMGGHLGDATVLAAIGLGNVYTMATVFACATGINVAQITLTSQAFGAGELKRCGMLLNRGTLVLAAFYVPFLLPGLVFPVNMDC